MQAFFSIVIFAIIVVWLFGGDDDGDKKKTTKNKCQDEVAAYVMGQEFVKRNLKAPSTADFPWFSDSQVSVSYIGGCKHSVNGYVDAQNGFGAMIRTRYVLVVRYEQASATWYLEDITMI